MQGKVKDRKRVKLQRKQKAKALKVKNLPFNKQYPNAILIKNWEELRTLIPQESETHILEVNDYKGWIQSKNNSVDVYDNHYLSTHTFYGETYKWSTRTLQKCGFNVIIDNWDK